MAARKSTEGLDPDQNPPGLGQRSRSLLEFERLRSTSFFDDCRAHGYPALLIRLVRFLE